MIEVINTLGCWALALLALPLLPVLLVLLFCAVGGILAAPVALVCWLYDLIKD